ncbi:MAG: ATP synthase F1 subunit delta [Spirochaetota bacterium]
MALLNDVARVYASSIFEIAKEKNIISQVEEDLRVVAQILAEEADFKSYIYAPGITIEAKKSLMNKVFAGKISENTLDLLDLLIDNDRQDSISGIYEAFVKLDDEHNNRERITVISQASLEESLIASIKSQIGEKLKKEIIVTEKVDESILGGIIIKIGDLVIDGSLSKGLKNIKSNLLNSKVRSEVAYED